MIKGITLFFGIIFSLSIYAQSKYFIIDAQSSTPIENAHVLLKRDIDSIYTYSDKEGMFILPEYNLEDTIVITHISFEPICLLLREIQSDTLKLNQQVLFLDEIAITPDDAVRIFETASLRTRNSLLLNQIIKYNVHLREVRTNHEVVNVRFSYSSWLKKVNPRINTISYDLRLIDIEKEVQENNFLNLTLPPIYYHLNHISIQPNGTNVFLSDKNEHYIVIKSHRLTDRVNIPTREYTSYINKKDTTYNRVEVVSTIDKENIDYTDNPDYIMIGEITTFKFDKINGYSYFSEGNFVIDLLLKEGDKYVSSKIYLTLTSEIINSKIRTTGKKIKGTINQFKSM